MNEDVQPVNLAECLKAAMADSTVSQLRLKIYKILTSSFLNTPGDTNCYIIMMTFDIFEMSHFVMTVELHTSCKHNRVIHLHCRTLLTDHKRS